MALIQYLSRIHFDFGALARLADEISRLSLKRPLVVTDEGIVAAGILDRVIDGAGTRDFVLYDETTGNPTEASLDACMELWNLHGCDGIIAVGGGSAIDLSKAVALLASHGGRFSDFGVKSGGSETIGRVAPQIAIPTAAGTGAEVGRACVITLRDGRKTVAVNLNMVADAIICDPELTISLPPRLTAATGVDALSHGIETICSTTVNPPAEAIARDCVSRAAKWLPVAVEKGSSRDARWQMMMAALEGGMALQKGLGSAHAMANPLGEGGHHHGTLIGILLPHVLEFNASAIGERNEELTALLGGTEAPSRQVGDLVRSVGLPSRLSDLGISRSELREVAERAHVDHLSATNPRPASVDDYVNLLNSSF